MAIFNTHGNNCVVKRIYIKEIFIGKKLLFPARRGMPALFLMDIFSFSVGEK
ncbi:hypothetical protein [Pseudenterobacter timonensis]|uniref:hypothetical protein n=1 Tax=Pseudenterobacter timonensis TaxID=1755099 RepID=UPI00287728F3|nr:hypothetical protein [Pseudenterobacter timonensis]